MISLMLASTSFDNSGKTVLTLPNSILMYPGLSSCPTKFIVTDEIRTPLLGTMSCMKPHPYVVSPDETSELMVMMCYDMLNENTAGMPNAFITACTSVFFMKLSLLPREPCQPFSSTRLSAWQD